MSFMTTNPIGKILSGLLALAMLIGSAILACDLMGYGQHAAHAQQQYTVTTKDFYIPSSADPWGTAFDSQGHVWLAIPGCDPSPTCNTNTPPGEIAEFNPATSTWMNTYQLPTGYAQPLFLAFDSQGRLWFPLPMGNAIGMFNPSQNTFQQWAVPTANAGPWDLAIDGNGKVWFTEHFTNKIGRFDPATHTFLEVATPASNSQPYGIVVDASNNVWFTENNSSVARIGEYTFGGKLQEYKIRNSSSSGLTPHLITVDPNGNIWWSEGFVAAIAELKVAQAVPGTNQGVSEYFYPFSCSICGTHTSGISVDSNGLIWFDDSNQNIFGSFPDSGTGLFTTYNTPTAKGHPHDGLDIDGQNRIWFDEEFANKLAEAIQSGTPTPTPTVTSSPTLTALAQDTFQRPNQVGWGKASDGLTWGGSANNQNVFSINNDKGQVSNGSGPYFALLGPSVTDAEVLFSGSLSSFDKSSLGAVLRWTSAKNWYKASISGTSLVIQKKVNGTLTLLGKTAFAATAGTSYTVRFSVVNSTLSAKVWQTGTTEPANWMITVMDNSLPSGSCGLQMQVQSTTTAAITSFLATEP
jgi:virginiamycin B lyase